MVFVAGESSQDEAEEEAKPVTMKFARQETDEAKARRLASYDYLKKKQEEEAWCQLQYNDINVCKRNPWWLFEIITTTIK